MRKTSLLIKSVFVLSLLLGMNFSSIAQSISTYTFAYSVGTFTPITGGTLLGGTANDDQRFVDPAVPAGGTVNTGVGFPIGFNFSYNGAVYDRVAINNNGWICLGQSALTPAVNINSTSNISLSLSSTTVITPAQLRARIAVWNRDLQGQTGSELRIQTIGTSPNRVLVVQWTNYRRYLQTGDNLNWQVRLNETSNSVNVVYGTMTNTATTDAAPQLGLGGESASVFNNRTGTWTASTAGGTAAATMTFLTGTIPVSGGTYTWSPPLPCSGAPVAGTLAVSPSQTTYCGSASPTLTVTGQTQGTGITLQWQSSTNGTVWNDITGANGTSYIVPGITTSMLYRIRVICSTGPTATNSDPILINVAPNPVVGINPAVAFLCGSGSTTLTANGAASYVWAPGGATTTSITVNPTSTTVYTVTGTLGSCSTAATAPVNIAPILPAAAPTATPSSVCSGGSTQLSTIQAGTAYSVYAAPAGMVNVPGATVVANPSTPPNIDASLDDGYGSVVMPFSFNFYGNNYTTLYYSTNGAVGFTETLIDALTPQTIPSATNPNNLIALFWRDLNCSYVGSPSQITVGTLGVAPNRRFVITYDQVATHATSAPWTTANTNTGQIILYETTNRIDVIVVNTPSTNKTLGIENLTGTVGVSPTGRNNATWTVSAPGEAYTFIRPTYNYAWTPSGGLSSTSVYNPTASNITANTTYNVAVTDAFTGCTSSGSVSITANPLPTATMTTTTSTVCAGQQPSITITGTPNTNVVYSINGANQPAVSTGSGGTVTFTPPAISANTAYALVSATTPATTCSATLTGGVNVTVNERPSGYFTGTNTICKDDQVNNFISFASAAGVSVFPIYLTFTDGTTTYTDTAAGAGENFPVPSNVPGMYTYTLTSMTSGTNGCVALPGDMTGSAMMEVKELPTAVVTSADAGVCPGGSTTITLTFTGDAPFLFNYYDGTAVVGGSSNATTFTFNPTLTATTTYYVDQLVSGTIFCQATPADIADDETVTVYDTTTITSQPIAAITTCSETDATITVTAIGENLTYTWYENGVQVSGPNYTVNNNILTINNVTGLDGNQYYVIVHSDCGVDKTSTSTTINEDHSNNWSGTVSTNWNDPANWSCGSVPIVTTDVFISQTAPFQPMIEIPNAVSQDITLIGAASLTFVPGMQLSIYGDIMNTTGGTINGTGGKMILAGTVQNAAGPLTVDDLDVTGGGVKTFTNDVMVNGILNLVNGNIELGTANLTMTQPTTQTGGSPTSFIVTNGTGKVTGNDMGAVGGTAAPVTFHVGINNTSYTPVTLENLGDADNYSVRVINHVYEDGTGVDPTQVDNPVVDRTWMVEEGTVGGSIVNMTPSWNAPIDEINGFVQTNVFVTHYMGGDWTSTVGTSTDAPAATPGMFPGMWMTTEDSITSFSPFAVASTGQFPLAIRLGSVTATNAGARNKVQWKSETEDAGDVYELESSADGRKFTKIATVAAKGEASTYMQWDESPVQGVNYYRVKLLNNDGTYSYSKVVTATVKGKDGFSIEAYPNPVKNMVSVKVDGVVAGNAKVVVTDVTGKVVRTATAVMNNGAEINVSDLASGVYLLNYSDDTRNESIKITKQ